MPPVQHCAKGADAKEDDQPVDIERTTPAKARNEPGVERVEEKSAQRGAGADDAHGRAARADEPVADDGRSGHHDARNACRHEATKREVVVPERLGATGERQTCRKEKSADWDENLRPETVIEASGQR
jgi:hypothetical protein